MISSDEFREFVRDYEPRANFPHPSTINHIAEAVQALQAPVFGKPPLQSFKSHLLE
jgi:hypothetical protein